MFRRIAIPLSLLTFLDNTGVTGKLPIGESTVRRHLNGLYRETGLKLTAKIFRKDFAHKMEEAGTDESIINLHQGREQILIRYMTVTTLAFQNFSLLFHGIYKLGLKRTSTCKMFIQRGIMIISTSFHFIRSLFVPFM